MMAYQGWQVCSAADLAPMIQACRSEAPDAPLRLAIVDDELGRLAGTIGLGRFHSAIAARSWILIWRRPTAGAACRGSVPGGGRLGLEHLWSVPAASGGMGR